MKHGVEIPEIHFGDLRGLRNKISGNGGKGLQRTRNKVLGRGERRTGKLRSRSAGLTTSGFKCLWELVNFKSARERLPNSSVATDLREEFWFSQEAAGFPQLVLEE